MEESELLIIPRERVGALIGKNGSAKKEIERKTETKIVVDSHEGEAEITRNGDAIKFWQAIKIVKAIGRGFSPEHAMRLLNEETVFELLELRDYVGKSENAMKSRRGRVIGEHGRARELIEEETGANISVYGKTVGIIGTQEEVEKAVKAVRMLLLGAGHDKVFGQLKRKLAEERFEL